MSVPDDTDSYDLAKVPTIEQYRAAFVACRADMTDLDLAMLEAHHRAPDHTVTATQLAEAVGLANFSAANLHYGTYASRLCTVLGRAPRIFVAILVRFSCGDQPGDEITWTMLPEVVSALEQMRWVRPR